MYAWSYDHKIEVFRPYDRMNYNSMDYNTQYITTYMMVFTNYQKLQIFDKLYFHDEEYQNIGKNTKPHIFTPPLPAREWRRENMGFYGF